MAGGRTKSSPKTQPAHQQGVKLNKVPYGKGTPLQSGPSGTNKRAPLEGKDIKKGQPVSKGVKQNDGHNSPVGKQRPSQDGGPRKGQTSGVDFSLKSRTTKKDWAWSV